MKNIYRPLFSVIPFLGLLVALPVIALAQGVGLGTRAGQEIGGSINSYTYDEPGYMDLKAVKVGVDYAMTRTFPGTWPRNSETSFFTGELRFANGDAKYTNTTGTTGDGLSDWYWEARALFGVDIDMNGYVLAPFMGVGYRYLYNDLRALSNGYRRESRYVSIPIGVTLRTRFSDQSQLHTTVEYVHLVNGRQDALLSDIGGSRQDVTLNQKNGNGLRLKIIQQFPTWSIGPTFTYWSLAASDVGGTPAVFEPKNNTVEVGVSFKHRF
jgi:hypothetical protein